MALADLLDDLAPDEGRAKNPYSADLAQASEDLLAATSDDARAGHLAIWLQHHQPCSFGRMAAKTGLISYCFLTDEDLAQTDRFIRSKIARSRQRWREEARSGDRHAFVIAALSRRLMEAAPNDSLCRFALGLASLYLNTDVEANRIMHDELFLEAGDVRRVWRVGVNYFSSQGDGRWWHDHRFPGGMAFSMNSVGHMALCVRGGKGRLVPDDPGLLWALRTAMLLIDETKNGPAPRDTWLLDLGDVPATAPCPMESVPSRLRDKNYCQYGGLYHTDVTVPEEYFSSASVRPDIPVLINLDLTYLHHDSEDNPDFHRIGRGVEY